MIRLKVLCTLAAVALAGSAFGSIHTWDGGAGDDNPNAADNWDNDTAPSGWTAGDVGIINTDVSYGGFSWEDSVELRFDGDHTMAFGTGKVVVKAGSITVTNDAALNFTGQFHIDNTDGTAVPFEISSGSVAVDADLALWKGNTANQTGGSVQTPNVRVLAGSVYNLSGGNLFAEDYLNFSDGGYINFTTGSTGNCTIEEDSYDFAALVDNGSIRSNGLTTTMDAFDIDNSVGGETTISLIPEPATFGLLGIFGLVYLLRRKLSN